MVGRAVSSRTPTDFHPSEVMASPGSPPVTNLCTDRGPHMGCPHWAVGMQSAADSEIGLPSMPTSASRMLAFVTPPEVRSSFIAKAPWHGWGFGQRTGRCRRLWCRPVVAGVDTVHTDLPACTQEHAQVWGW